MTPVSSLHMIVICHDARMNNDLESRAEQPIDAITVYWPPMEGDDSNHSLQSFLHRLYSEGGSGDVHVSISTASNGLLSATFAGLSSRHCEYLLKNHPHTSVSHAVDSEIQHVRLQIPERPQELAALLSKLSQEPSTEDNPRQFEREGGFRVFHGQMAHTRDALHSVCDKVVRTKAPAKLFVNPMYTQKSAGVLPLDVMLSGPGMAEREYSPQAQRTIAHIEMSGFSGAPYLLAHKLLQAGTEISSLSIVPLHDIPLSGMHRESLQYKNVGHHTLSIDAFCSSEQLQKRLRDAMSQSGSLIGPHRMTLSGEDDAIRHIRIFVDSSEASPYAEKAQGRVSTRNESSMISATHTIQRSAALVRDLIQSDESPVFSLNPTIPTGVPSLERRAPAARKSNAIAMSVGRD